MTRRAIKRNKRQVSKQSGNHLSYILIENLIEQKIKKILVRLCITYRKHILRENNKPKSA